MTSETKTLSGRQAVLEGMPDHPALKAILAWNADALTDANFAYGELTLTIDPEAIRAACSALQAAGYNFFEDMTAIDWFPTSPRFQLSYHILSHKLLDRIRLRVMLGEADPTVDSITPVWPGANFFEREVFDLFGIRFDEHPDLRRIMMPDDWKGHPLRKDYPVEGYR
ncbi:NADH-quinone oxidoreductase subunit C [Candidatus Sulfotelmatomonas gaucii]|uniref:NADH-quinone oxidoreductase subunit C n=1 Tax=Candidatus Sulfuritelmatomonas gaucii TaxID=2043161 RepID=A0A2N9LSR1_9BACT|nr:NADH-quinone oxidoreductase subunit C [Candidatus Sulfotelmatomonas gaucii]